MRKWGFLVTFVQTLDNMKSYIHVLSHLENAFTVLSTNDVDEHTLNQALYGCIYPSDISVSSQIKNYYTHYVSDNLPFDVRQKKVRKKTVDLLNKLVEYGYKDIPNFDVRKHFEIGQILRWNYLPRERFLADSRQIEGFDFDVYRLTKSVSQPSEMNEIHGYSTKLILLEWYLIKLIQEINESIYSALNEVNLVDGKDGHRVMPDEYSKFIVQVKSICLGEEPKVKVIGCGDKRGLLSDYCKVYPSKETNLNKMIEFLEYLKDRMKINRHECNKKTFAALTYILYKSQSSIGMKPKSFKTFAKFKKLMSMYYDMPENSFKENDIKELALEIKDAYPCFNNVKFDE